jgi:general secretion pathway protein G
MKECCETEGPRKKRYWHWVALAGVVLVAAALQMIPDETHYHGSASSNARANVATILQSLVEYSSNNAGAYPTSLQPLVTPDANGNAYLDGYKGRIPLDPWKHEYLYEAPTAEHPKPHVWSYGADGKRGGIGEDADIDSDRLTDESR